MPNWKKVITSGSNAELNQITASNGILANKISSSGDIRANEYKFNGVDSKIYKSSNDIQFAPNDTDTVTFSETLTQFDTPVKLAGASSHLTASGNISSSGTITGLSASFKSADINGGTIDGITSLTAGGNLDIGSHTFRAHTLQADNEGLILGPANSDGILLKNHQQTAMSIGQADDDSVVYMDMSADEVIIPTRLDLTGTTDATNASGDTGTLRVEGGASIAKKVFVGTDLSVGNDITASGNISGSASTFFSGQDGFFTREIRVGGASSQGAAGISANGNISSSGTISMLTASIGGGIFTSASLAAGGGGGSTNAAGSDTQVQFNDGGTNFGGDAGLVFNKTSNLLTAGAITSTGDITANGNIAGDNSTNISGIANITTLGDSSFGNAATDTHTITGHITASGDISASGTLVGSQLLIGHQTTNSSIVKAQISHHQDAGAPVAMDFLKSRGTLASPTTLQQGDFTGTQRYFGHDGSSYRVSAAIRGDIDSGATVGTNVMPGALNFLTTTNGSLQSRIFIASTGNVGIGVGDTNTGPGELLTVDGNISSSDAVKAHQYYTDGNLALDLNNGITRIGTNNNSTGILLGKAGANTQVTVVGHITASQNISSSATSTGSLARLELFGGAIDLKNAGNQSYVNFYCESSNAHYAQIKAPAHSDFSGNVTTILPSYDFDFNTPNFDANITASGAISASAETTSSFGSIMVGGGFFSSASLAAAGSSGGGGGSADNLGNHTATQDLNLNGNDILGIQHITMSAGGNISASFTSTGSIGRVEATSLATSGSGRGILEVDYRLFDTGSAHMASASYGGAQGDVVKFGQVSGLTAGNIVYLKPDGQWANARANALTTSTGSLGVALGSSAQGDGVLLKGMVQLSVDPATGIGSPVFLSDTAAGEGLKTAPDSGGDVVRIVGHYYGNSGLVYFNPDNTFIEVA
tara:strand:+ start:2326 stop:5124 length:2799 start_codon:yes stop_codon:yes gene_type:complete